MHQESGGYVEYRRPDVFCVAQQTPHERTRLTNKLTHNTTVQGDVESTVPLLPVMRRRSSPFAAENVQQYV